MSRQETACKEQRVVRGVDAVGGRRPLLARREAAALPKAALLLRRSGPQGNAKNDTTSSSTTTSRSVLSAVAFAIPGCRNNVRYRRPDLQIHLPRTPRRHQGVVTIVRFGDFA